MDRIKTFFKYVIWIVLFFIFSEIMINLYLESTYKDIERKDELVQVSIYQAQATKVNGRIKGAIYNDTNNIIKNTYLKINFFSERGNLLGSQYIDVSNMRENETRNLETYFKIQDVNYFNMEFTDEKVEGEIPMLKEDLTRSEVVWGVFLTFLIFW